MPKIENVEVFGLERAIKTAKYPKAVDINSLNSELTKGIQACSSCPSGTGHDNFLKGIIVTFDLTFSEKAYTQIQRYHFIDFISSQSTMHRITRFSVKNQCNRYVDHRVIDILQEKIDEYNRMSALPILDDINSSMERKKILDDLYLHILYNIPSGFELTAGMVTNYLQLKTIYKQRRNHRLLDWQIFCDWCETLPRFMELTQKEKNDA